MKAELFAFVGAAPAPARLKAKAVTFKSEIIPSPVCRMSIIEDSEGNSIVLHQRKAK
jgi:hypothetical protein